MSKEGGLRKLSLCILVYRFPEHTEGALNTRKTSIWKFGPRSELEPGTYHMNIMT
jgi:hypothetical protein